MSVTVKQGDEKMLEMFLITQQTGGAVTVYITGCRRMPKWPGNVAV
jgi:hypothetical protein